MEERNVHQFEREKTLMETFLSQASSSEVFPTDVLFIQRSYSDSENFENKQFFRNSFSVCVHLRLLNFLADCFENFGYVSVRDFCSEVFGIDHDWSVKI